MSHRSLRSNYKEKNLHNTPSTFSTKATLKLYSFLSLHNSIPIGGIAGLAVRFELCFHYERFSFIVNNQCCSNFVQGFGAVLSKVRLIDNGLMRGKLQDCSNAAANQNLQQEKGNVKKKKATLHLKSRAFTCSSARFALRVQICILSCAFCVTKRQTKKLKRAVK